MVATFVIGLREGLEAALIVGIVAAFLRTRGRGDLLRAVYAGLGLAVLLCLGAGIALELLSRDLPQRRQEGLESVIGAVAVGTVTYMIIWMRRHSRQLKGQLEQAAGSALATGSGWALVGMAFLAVLREGLETVVFLFAAAEQTDAGGLALLGAVLGIAVAIGLGYGIYRGGVRINLSSFFRATGGVLVLVAAGLVASALHTAHEAGWIDVGQRAVLDLSAVAGAGTVQGALLTGVLGIQPRPVLLEVLGWGAYVLAVGPYVVWPPGRSSGRSSWWSTARRLGLSPDPARLVRPVAVVGLACATGAAGLFVAAPAGAAPDPVSSLDGIRARLVSRSATAAALDLTVPAGRTGGADVGGGRVTLTEAGVQTVSGVRAQGYARTVPVAGPVWPDNLPATLTRAQVAALNGGRLPIGLPVGDSPVRATYTASETTTAWVEPITGRVLRLVTRTSLRTDARLPVGEVALSVVRQTTGASSAAAVVVAARSARRDVAALHRRHLLRGLGIAVLVLAVTLLALAALLRLRPTPAAPVAVRSVRMQV